MVTLSGVRRSIRRLVTTRPSNHILSPFPLIHRQCLALLWWSRPSTPIYSKMPLHHFDGRRKAVESTASKIKPSAQTHTLSPPRLDSTSPPHSTPHQSISPCSLPFSLLASSLLASASTLPQYMPQRHDRVDVLLQNHVPRLVTRTPFPASHILQTNFPCWLRKKNTVQMRDVGQGGGRGAYGVPCRALPLQHTRG
jgi:hypothetical protein